MTTLDFKTARIIFQKINLYQIFAFQQGSIGKPGPPGFPGNHINYLI